MALSIPRAVIADAIGQKVTIETTAGETFSGVLESIDDNFNLRLTFSMVRSKAGEYGATSTVTVPGPRVKLVTLPSAMRNAPFFKDVVSGAIGGTKKPKTGKKKPSK